MVPPVSTLKFAFVCQSGRPTFAWKDNQKAADEMRGIFIKYRSSKTAVEYEYAYQHANLKTFADTNDTVKHISELAPTQPTNEFRKALLNLTEINEANYVGNGPLDLPGLLQDFKNEYCDFDRSPELIIIHDASQYDGFNPAKVRARFLNGRTFNDATMKLIQSFIAYAAIGNNVRKLTIKRVDTNISQALMSTLGNFDIVKKAAQNDSLTLPRIAISFMPEYLIYRTGFHEGLQVQTESTIGVKYQDIVFYGYKSIRDISGYTDFHCEFSKFIYNPKSEEDLNIKKFEKDYARWNKVSSAGLRSDPKMTTRMAAAYSRNDDTPTAAFNAIKSNIKKYLLDPSYEAT